MKTHEELPKCDTCSATAPFLNIDGKNLCAEHWRLSPHYQQLTAERLARVNEDE